MSSFYFLYFLFSIVFCGSFDFIKKFLNLKVTEEIPSEEYLTTDQNYIRKRELITDTLYNDFSFPRGVVNLVHEYRIPESHFELYDKIMNRLSISQRRRNNLNFYQNDFIPKFIKELKKKRDSVIKPLAWTMIPRLILKHLIYQGEYSRNSFTDILKTIESAYKSLEKKFDSISFPMFSKFSRLDFDHEKDKVTDGEKFSRFFWELMNAEFLENENDIHVASSILSNFYYKTGDCDELLSYFSSPLNETVNNVLIEAIIFKYDFNGELKKCFNNPSHSIKPLAKKDHEYESIKTEIVKFHKEAFIISEKIKHFYEKNGFRLAIANENGFETIFNEMKMMKFDPKETMEKIFGFPNEWNQDIFDEYTRKLKNRNIIRSFASFP